MSVAASTSLFSVFFFQAEDGIRDYKVTGVQTCALPICPKLTFVSRKKCHFKFETDTNPLRLRYAMNTTPSTGQLAGRRILVTGSARGLGFAFAKAFCEQGARVAMADLREELLAESVARLRAQGLEAHGFGLDAGNPESIERCAQQAVQALGGLDGLVNNAAVTDSGGKGMDDIDLDKWDQVMNVNVRGVWLMTRACRAALRDSGRGAIVNLASDTAMWGAPNLMAYVASKGAVMAMTRSEEHTSELQSPR